MKKRSEGFTLVEILVVLAIIAVLAALLFPAFKSARENSRQTTCLSNMQQISLAVQQYRKDFARYPDSLLDLLGEGSKFDDGTATGNTVAANTATGYLRGGADSLICLDDDTISDKPRASYGSLSKITPAALPAYPMTQATVSSFTGDWGQYVWNYWGVREDGFAYTTAADAATATWSKAAPHAPFGTPPANAALLADPTRPFNDPRAPNYDATLPPNVLKYSLANRFAPVSTIITHCVFHRLPTANNVNSPGELYVAATSAEAVENAKNVKEIVLRVDGSSKTVDVSTWKDNLTWQKQTP